MEVFVESGNDQNHWTMAMTGVGAIEDTEAGENVKSVNAADVHGARLWVIMLCARACD
jgi:hypothetical protein